MITEILLPKLNLTIVYPLEINYLDWKYLNNNLKDVRQAIEDIIDILNLEKVYSKRKNYKGNLINPESFTYSVQLSYFYWYLLHIDNPFEYNNYLDRIIALHKRNLTFYSNHKEITNKVKKKEPPKRPYRPKNEFFKETKIDMFTGKEKYTYYNPVTGEQFVSDDPNKLKELNSKPKESLKHKKAVPLNAMTFNFNPKKVNYG